MKIVNIIIGLIGTALCWTACSEEDINGYSACSYIYFNKSINDSTVFSFAYEPELTVGTVSLKLNTISKLENYDRTFAVRFLPEESTAQEGRDFTYSTNDLVVKANDSIAYMKIELKKNDHIAGSFVKAVFEVVSNENFEQGLLKNRKAKVIISDKLSQPAWWDRWHESSGLGIYSDKKYALFIQEIGIYDLTLKEDGGEMDYYTMRGYVQMFKYWLYEHPQKEDDGSDMTVPIIG